MKKLLIKTRTGRFVRLDDVADVHREEASNLVIHENGRRQALITLNPAPGVSVGELVNSLASRLGPELAAFGCTAEFGGTYQANISARRTLVTFSVVLLFVVFFVLLVATKSWGPSSRWRLRGGSSPSPRPWDSSPWPAS